MTRVQTVNLLASLTSPLVMQHSKNVTNATKARRQSARSLWMKPKPAWVKVLMVKMPQKRGGVKLRKEDRRKKTRERKSNNARKKKDARKNNVKKMRGRRDKRKKIVVLRKESEKKKRRNVDWKRRKPRKRENARKPRERLERLKKRPRERQKNAEKRQSVSVRKLKRRPRERQKSVSVGRKKRVRKLNVKLLKLRLNGKLLKKLKRVNLGGIISSTEFPLPRALSPAGSGENENDIDCEL